MINDSNNNEKNYDNNIDDDRNNDYYNVMIMMMMTTMMMMIIVFSKNDLKYMTEKVFGHCMHEWVNNLLVIFSLNPLLLNDKLLLKIYDGEL